MRYQVIALVAATTLAGCGVSKQVAAEKDAALEACRANMITCQDREHALFTEAEDLKADLAEARSRVVSSNRALDTAMAQAEACAEDNTRALKGLAGLQQDLKESLQASSTLRGIESELRTRLEEQTRECTVDIDRLRGQLHIRVLDQLVFPPGSADILPEGRALLDQIATALQEGDDWVRVEGHTDEVPIGPTLKARWFSNWELSAARAAAVVRYFQYGHGVDPRRMVVVGRSSFNPVAANDTPENRGRNRRVEIVLTARP